MVAESGSIRRPARTTETCALDKQHRNVATVTVIANRLVMRVTPDHLRLVIHERSITPPTDELPLAGEKSPLRLLSIRRRDRGLLTPNGGARQPCRGLAANHGRQVSRCEANASPCACSIRRSKGATERTGKSYRRLVIPGRYALRAFRKRWPSEGTTFTRAPEFGCEKI